MVKRLPRGVKKYIRRQKAQLRQQSIDSQEYRRAVEMLYQRYTKS